LVLKFSVDTNRIYVGGSSEGGHVAWDTLGLRPDFFAAAIIQSGSQGNTPARSIRQVPLWGFQAADDTSNPPANSRSYVNALRQKGGDPVYTEYASGGHIGAIGAASACLL
jgi:predicted peptidase